MSYNVYILQSETSGRHYIGYAKDISVRIIQHNAGMTKSTKSGRPWKVMYVEELVSRKEAIQREKQIKSYKGGEAFKKLLRRDARVA